MQPAATAASKVALSNDSQAFLAVSLSAVGLGAMPFVSQVRFTPSMMQADQPAKRLRYAFIVSQQDLKPAACGSRC